MGVQSVPAATSGLRWAHGQARAGLCGQAVRGSAAPAPGPGPAPSDASNAAVRSPQSAWCRGARGRVPDQNVLTSSLREPPSLWGYCGVLAAHVPADPGTSLGPWRHFARRAGAPAPLGFGSDAAPAPGPAG